MNRYFLKEDTRKTNKHTKLHFLSHQDHANKNRKAGKHRVLARMLLVGGKIGSANFEGNWKYLLRNLQSWTYKYFSVPAIPLLACTQQNAYRESPKDTWKTTALLIITTNWRLWEWPSAVQQTSTKKTIFLRINEPKLHKTTWRDFTEEGKGESNQTQESILYRKRQTWAGFLQGHTCEFLLCTFMLLYT